MKGMPWQSDDAPSRDLLLFFFTLVTGPRRSLSLKLSDTRVYEPQLRARLGTTAHFCRVVVRKLRGVPNWCWVMMIGDAVHAMSPFKGQVQGYLAHKKLPPPRTLKWAYA